jgi:hypothetical protein
MTCGFTLEHYREILEMGLGHDYRFIGFEEADTVVDGQRVCVLRHDIDYMPEWAPSMARIEVELGVKATYFFQTTAKTYNLRETEVFRIVHSLGDMGHTIGLHFDVEWDPTMEWDQLAARCEEEKRIFELITGIAPCAVVSLHNPHRFREQALGQVIPGLRTTYEPAYFNDLKYLSDSQGWYEGCMCKLFAAQTYDRIQLTLHPYIWPVGSHGDYVSDAAEIVRLRARELVDYMVEFNPVCRKFEARLRLMLSPCIEKRKSPTASDD